MYTKAIAGVYTTRRQKEYTMTRLAPREFRKNIARIIRNGQPVAVEKDRKVTALLVPIAHPKEWFGCDNPKHFAAAQALANKAFRQLRRGQE